MIIIADNQPLTHDALVSYFANQPLCFAANKQQLAEKLEQSVDAVVVIDFSLFNFTTPEQMLIYLRRFAQARWLMLSAEFAPNLVHLLGAEPQVSFLTKDCTRNDVLQAVYNLQQGERVVCAVVAEMLHTVSATYTHDVHLTPTEISILQLIAQGKSAKAIAEERCSSVHTIVTHKKNIFRKLGVSTTYEATRYALRAGWVQEVEYFI